VRRTKKRRRSVAARRPSPVAESARHTCNACADANAIFDAPKNTKTKNRTATPCSPPSASCGSTPPRAQTTRAARAGCASRPWRRRAGGRSSRFPPQK
jgi:hypothetical protein